ALVFYGATKFKSKGRARYERDLWKQMWRWSVGEWDILVGCAPRTKCLGLIDAEKEPDPVPEAIPRTDSWTGWREPTRVGGRRDWQNVRRRERRVRGGGRWLVGFVIRGAKIKNVSIFRVVALLTIFTSFIVKNKSSRDIDEFNGF
ncbi:hypothetical protein U1Q18_047390, partial [Sarracenia purpurea var. burkii]